MRSEIVFMKRSMNLRLTLIYSIALLLSASCTSSRPPVIHSLTGGRLELTAALDAAPDTAVQRLVHTYKNRIDRVMSPVIGCAAVPLTVDSMDSPLSRLVADVLREAAVRHCGRKADVGIINIGAIRSALPAGDITLRHLYEVLPFDNRFCVLTLSGSQLRELFAAAVRERSVAVSGCTLTADASGHLLAATVGGSPLDDTCTYRVATIDYLAEGNSRMVVLGTVTQKEFPPGVYLRDLFADHLSALRAAGDSLTAPSQRRILLQSETAP